MKTENSPGPKDRDYFIFLSRYLNSIKLYLKPQHVMDSTWLTMTVRYQPINPLTN